MVELEAISGFGFQGNRWLADVAPHLLSQDLRDRVARAKEGAKRRVELEKLLPKHLHYVKGWPTHLPTTEEAELIARVRRGVAEAVGIEVKCTTGAEVLARYAELLSQKAKKPSLPKNRFTRHTVMATVHLTNKGPLLLSVEGAP